MDAAVAADAEAQGTWCVRADDAAARRPPGRRLSYAATRSPWPSPPAATRRGPCGSATRSVPPSTRVALPLRHHRSRGRPRRARRWRTRRPRPHHHARPRAAGGRRRRHRRPARSPGPARGARRRRRGHRRRQGPERAHPEPARDRGAARSTGPAAGCGSSGSRAATPTCSAAAARRPSPASPRASPSRSSPASPPRSPSRRSRASRSPTEGWPAASPWSRPTTLTSTGLRSPAIEGTLVLLMGVGRLAVAGERARHPRARGRRPRRSP